MFYYGTWALKTVIESWLFLIPKKILKQVVVQNSKNSLFFYLNYFLRLLFLKLV
jgi:hypothetical protein